VTGRSVWNYDLLKVGLASQVRYTSERLLWIGSGLFAQRLLAPGFWLLTPLLGLLVLLGLLELLLGTYCD
jgi:hypothetical protein